MATAKPDMSVIWALAGSSVKPPDTKIQEGWLAEKPPFQTENWSQQRQDQYLKHIDERGVPEWGNQSEYEQGALVWYNNLIWESQQPNNLGNIPQNGLGFWLSQDYLDRRGDVMSGLLALEQGLNLTQDLSMPGSEIISWLLENIRRVSIGRGTTTINTDFLISIFNSLGALSNSFTLKEDGTAYIDGGLIWTRNNDGQGSGLDADMLDGQHLTEILTGISGGTISYSIPGTYFFTVPTGVYLMSASLCGAGQGGGGGGDGGGAPCDNGPPALIGDSTIITSINQNITAFGGDNPKINKIWLDTPITRSTDIINTHYSIGNPWPPGNANPIRGGHGGSSLFGLGGLSDTRTGGPFPEWNGNRGGGGAGGGGLTGYGGNGGASGMGASNIPIATIPGEIMSIIIGNGSAGTTGCRGTGGSGGAGYCEINW